MDSNGARLKSAIAQVWRGLSLAGSPLLADLRGAPRSWWRSILGLVAGAVGGLVLALIAAVVIAIPVMIVLILQGMDPQAPGAFFEEIQKPDYEPGFAAGIGMIW